MYKTRFDGLYLCLILLGVNLLAGCPHTTTSPPVPPKPKPEFRLKQTGVDFIPVLGCIGSTESKMVERKYDQRQRLIGYTEVVTCLNTGNL